MEWKLVNNGSRVSVLHEEKVWRSVTKQHKSSLYHQAVYLKMVKTETYVCAVCFVTF